jgi:hypothetical protein
MAPDRFLTHLGLDQKMFAKMAGIHPATISRTVRGVSSPTLAVIWAFWVASKGKVGVADWKKIGERKENGRRKDGLHRRGNEAEGSGGGDDGGVVRG